MMPIICLTKVKLGKDEHFHIKPPTQWILWQPGFNGVKNHETKNEKEFINVIRNIEMHI